MEKIDAQLKKVLESKVLLKLLSIITVIVIVILIFTAGVSVGFHKASFGRAWGDNYYANFGMPVRHVLGAWDIDDSPNAHGAIGKIIKIQPATIIVQDKDNTEKVISIKEDTKIEKVRTQIQMADLKVNDFVVIIGSPNTQGQIEAKFIRVMPAPAF